MLGLKLFLKKIPMATVRDDLNRESLKAVGQFRSYWNSPDNIDKSLNK